ncbi:FkbM family methyltransferase [Bacillus sp. JJ1521]|uniref:FkbM family methyltransferase n=1 Tax=Bacillus sp. JJ1521 TaxID=3122957 RepID=UPI00300047C7
MNNTFFIENIEKRPEFFKSFNQIIQHINSKPMILFGAGKWGEYYLKVIKRYCSEIIFCDNSPLKWGTTIEGIPVISFDEVNRRYKDYFITITSLDYFEEIYELLESKKLESRIVLPIAGFTKDEYRDFPEVINENKDKVSLVYNFLSDNRSKQIFTDRINCCISGNPKYLIPLKSKTPQYFDPEIIKLTSHEVFVDGGGYTGDTVEEFVRQTKGEFKKLYSFEPEETKHIEFLKKFKGNEKIKLLPYGLWSSKDVFRFSGTNDGSSNINEDGNIEIPVDNVDRILNNEPITFIKMDIEGAELEALKGAEKSIKKYKPKLAICVYHKPLDFIEIPLYLKSIVPEYKIYLRHYNINIYETVCYAVAD